MRFQDCVESSLKRYKRAWQGGVAFVYRRYWRAIHSKDVFVRVIVRSHDGEIIMGKDLLSYQLTFNDVMATDWERERDQERRSDLADKRIREHNARILGKTRKAAKRRKRRA
jgi:hypothetical protein